VGDVMLLTRAYRSLVDSPEISEAGMRRLRTIIDDIETLSRQQASTAEINADYWGLAV
jgi:hypothetical protein